MAGKGGGAWKVAYADFVTAMMAFFLVMWIVGQSKQVKQAVAAYFRDPSGCEIKSDKPGRAPPGEPFSLWPDADKKGPGDGARGDGKKTNRKSTRGVHIKRQGFFALHNGDQAMRGTVLLFPENSAELDSQATDRLQAIIPVLLGKRNKIEIRGHSSRKPLPENSKFDSPWQLCYARCLATMKYLEKANVEPDRFRLSLAGPYEPYTVQAEDDLQLHNSRVEVYVLGELVEDLVGTREERAQQYETPFGQKEEPAAAASDTANAAPVAQPAQVEPAPSESAAKDEPPQ